LKARHYIAAQISLFAIASSIEAFNSANSSSGHQYFDSVGKGYSVLRDLANLALAVVR
jgi:hypothetical protein